MKLRLNVMMFMEFFTWGGWFVTMGSFLAINLHATGEQSGVAYSTQAWGAIIAPFIVGLIADRYFHAERLLGVIHLVVRRADADARAGARLRALLSLPAGVHDPLHADAGAGQCGRVPADGRAGAGFSQGARLGHDRLDRRGAGDQLHLSLGRPGGARRRCAAQYLHHVRGELVPARRIQLHAAAHSAARRRTGQAQPGKPARLRCAGDAARAQLRRLLLRLDPDLRAARVLLSGRQPVPDRDPRCATRPASRRWDRHRSSSSCCCCRSS